MNKISKTKRKYNKKKCKKMVKNKRILSSINSNKKKFKKKGGVIEIEIEMNKLSTNQTNHNSNQTNYNSNKENEYKTVTLLFDNDSKIINVRDDANVYNSVLEAIDEKIYPGTKVNLSVMLGDEPITNGTFKDYGIENGARLFVQYDYYFGKLEMKNKGDFSKTEQLDRIINELKRDKSITNHEKNIIKEKIRELSRIPIEGNLKNPYNDDLSYFLYYCYRVGNKECEKLLEEMGVTFPKY